MNEKCLRVLLVEDNVGDARIIQEMLRSEIPGFFQLTHLLRLTDAESFLAVNGTDLVLLDMGLPDAHGIESVQRIQSAAPDVAMIVLTGLNDETVASQAMRHGAQDYLIKGQIENHALPRALRHAVERHQMQRETEHLRAQQLQLKDEFLSHVSHELRSPLTAIYAFASLIADGLAGETTAQTKDYLKLVLQNVQQLKAMIEDLIEVRQAGTGKLCVDPQRVALLDLLESALPAFQFEAKNKEILLIADLCPTLPDLLADPTRLRQVIIILLDNALKFTRAGGTVRLEARLSASHLGFVEMRVTDTGCGIASEETEKVFHSLYQVKDQSGGRKGLGLGLHIARELVTRMGGTIWVESELNKGSSFCFTAPVLSVAGVLEPLPRTAKSTTVLVPADSIESRVTMNTHEAVHP